MNKNSSIDLKNLYEFVKIHLLGNLTIRMKFVGLEDILFRSGSGQDYYRNMVEVLMGFAHRNQSKEDETQAI